MKKNEFSLSYKLRIVFLSGVIILFIINSYASQKTAKDYIQDLKSKDIKVVDRALEYLAETEDDPTIVPALIEALEEEEVIIRAYAARLLGYREDERIIAPLIKALKDEEDKVQMNAAEALGFAAKFAKLQAIKDAVPSLIEILKDENKYVRIDAASALGEIKDKRAILPLLIALEDKEEWVQSYAAEGLVEI
jgi:HEAT repeat protein